MSEVAPDLKARLQKIEFNAKAKIGETYQRDNSLHYKSITHVPREPVFIASTEDIGTMRVR
eukprot:CAMPEP_0181326622 /NCGR_PEP_ID=MMETSP1101-20121128/21611_1 /TAXON_ID=46948 /ORGANISM="Rhodomonas abbreviata, Strain Caron Lab Isolate" /LENGTH=60 /DNA_ID=CAMNT_0023435117 /DNA_START=84 /DNA_END=262 /DNA_ORIENTATION=+